MLPNQLSSHFTVKEATESDIAERNGLDNSIPSPLIPAVLNTALGMELVRTALGGKEIKITSWYRCPELNLLVKSRPTSQHTLGEAVDFKCPAFGTPTMIVKYLTSIASMIRFDQLILEFSWVHISFKSNPDIKPRGEVLSLLSNGGYAVGITDKEGRKLS